MNLWEINRLVCEEATRCCEDGQMDDLYSEYIIIIVIIIKYII